jgi:POT family proton-dependent oligopeptide transporter
VFRDKKVVGVFVRFHAAVFTTYSSGLRFEQTGSMTIFAEKYTQRELFGVSASIFKIADALMTIIPLLVITYVLVKLFKQTFKKYATGNIILATSFVIIWGIVLWKVGREFAAVGTEVPATWFGILNSLFIVCFAPVFQNGGKVDTIFLDQ